MSLGAPGLLDSENTDSLGNINGYMSSARELLHRLDLLEKRQVRSYIHKVTASEECRRNTNGLLLDMF